jgi:hypothetical protein
VDADPAAVQAVQVTMDALVADEVRPFWSACSATRKWATTTSSTRVVVARRSGSSQ